MPSARGLLCVGLYINQRSSFPPHVCSVVGGPDFGNSDCGREEVARGEGPCGLAWRLRCHHNPFSPRHQVPTRSTFSPWLPPRAASRPGRGLGAFSLFLQPGLRLMGSPPAAMLFQPDKAFLPQDGSARRPRWRTAPQLPLEQRLLVPLGSRYLSPTMVLGNRS